MNRWTLAMTAVALSLNATPKQAQGVDRNFGEDVAFLSQHVETLVLGDASSGGTGARVAVVPAYQGRVMTSTSGGDPGISYGWLNYDHIASGKLVPQINVYGGEERFWLGPEGGQFALFFPPQAEFEFANWQTPAVIDSEPFDVVSHDKRRALFRRDAELSNYSGTKFRLRIERNVELIEPSDATRSLGIDVARVPFVGYRTTNSVTNTGSAAWTKDGGLLSIWLLGMYKHGPKTTVVAPYRQGPEADLGPVVNDDYFGKVPADRLRASDGVLFFSADGQFRSKIGLSPQRALDVCGSYDAQRNVLTIVKYNKPAPNVTDYVNSMWSHQERPFAGDAVNAYNDGPPAPGAKPLGPFYELETSSPALALQPGDAGRHVQETYHFEGSRSDLDAISKKLLGVSTSQIEAGLGGQ